MMKRIVRTVCVLTICMTVLALMPSNTYAAKESGSYPTKTGRILVTSDFYKGIIPTGHAAIVYDKNNVIEAQANGVVIGKNNWKKSRKEFWGCEVLTKKNGSTLSQKKQTDAANWCKKQKGKKYNFNYLDTSTRKKFYCSQLVWAAYKDNCKIDLNTWSFAGWYKGWGFANPVHPLELVASDYTRAVYYYHR